MADWIVNLALEPEAKTPIFAQIATAIADAVRAGRLRPGQRLPGSRSLAGSLGVHRNTVLAAFEELAAQGWIETARGRGTFISRALPDERPRRAPGAARRSALPRRPSYALAPKRAGLPTSDRSPPDAILLAGGVPDLRLVPAAPLWRAYRRALARGAPQLLGYGDSRGHERLRRALAEMLSATRGLAATDDDLVITRGSQMALHLVARTLVSPGDAVAVESFGYRPAWEALREAGARLVPVPVDGDGLDVDRLAAIVRRRRLRAVYVTPHHQYPTTVAMAPARRLALLDLARAHGFAILEDDYDNEFHYQGRPILPLASADTAGAVVYIGTLSKVLAPALRIGYVVAPAPVIERLVALREITDGQGDLITEAAVAELIEDGELQRHVRRMRRTYQARRETLVSALRENLPDALTFTEPPGGMALWTRAARGVDVEAWADRARDAGVVFSTAREFAFDGRARPFLRLGYARRTSSEITRGVRRMAAALPSR